MKMKILSDVKHLLDAPKDNPFHLDAKTQMASFKWPKDLVFGFKEKYFSLANTIFFSSKLGIRVGSFFFFFPLLQLALTRQHRQPK